MAEPPNPSERSDDPHLSIHRCLGERDPTAPNDLAVVFLEPLSNWLAARNRTIPSDWISEAAEDAILALIRDPDSYRPERGTLEAYLRMSAQNDLRNLLRRERKHRAGRTPIDRVEHSDDAGKYFG